ncbi:MAG: DNA mismatch endonuclease Vsr [Nitrospira sp.]|nr:MAG: DNA mismatch endonuclease Vsr [Nitrospira sp.]
MRQVRQKNTSAESALRSRLHALGLRYRVQGPILTKPRRVSDIMFAGPCVVVFVDGCFWHGCPEHGTWPKQNAKFWRAKIVTNQERDRTTSERLRAEGLEVVRIWAHEPPDEAAGRIANIVQMRKSKDRVPSKQFLPSIRRSDINLVGAMLDYPGGGQAE